MYKGEAGQQEQEKAGITSSNISSDGQVADDDDNDVEEDASALVIDEGIIINEENSPADLLYLNDRNEVILSELHISEENVAVGGTSHYVIGDPDRAAVPESARKIGGVISPENLDSNSVEMDRDGHPVIRVKREK
jgi:hypothetical protein